MLSGYITIKNVTFAVDYFEQHCQNTTERHTCCYAWQCGSLALPRVSAVIRLNEFSEDIHTHLASCLCSGGCFVLTQKAVCSYTKSGGQGGSVWRLEDDARRIKKSRPTSVVTGNQAHSQDRLVEVRGQGGGEPAHQILTLGEGLAGGD
ncbi:hypothetical protein E2C01_062141 [Portunus trituberculatus]|uniref:Uncharacterized protein n=1 Tax=Portunus trituberculatus TaxID=210409 RepID=A0A5B7HH74_PORTR|nr:hypothetical protein [Portunus trituberculatus]